MNRVNARLFRNSLRVLFLLGCSLSLSACLSLSGVFQIVEDGPERDPLVFQSERYAIYKLQGHETSEGLAQRFLKDRRKAWVIEDENEGVLFEKGNFIVIPLTEEHKGGLAPDGYQTVPVLCYHRLAERCESALCITTSLFESQMRYLKENGYRIITMAELENFLFYRRKIPRKAVIINLDDGYRSTYEIAYPILKKYGFTAGLFIYTDFIGASSDALTWAQIKEMMADGFEVGSHSLSHCDLTQKAEEEDEHQYLNRITGELVESKEIIDKKLDQNTIYFAYPYGKYNQRILSLAMEAGYRMAFSVKRGGNPFFSDPMALRRDQIVARDMGGFINSLDTFYNLSLR